MLHIIKQYKQLFISFINNKAMSNGENSGSDLSGTSKINSINKTQEKLNTPETQEIINGSIKAEQELSHEILSIDKFTRTLKLGSKGNDVRLLQIFLFKKYKIKDAKINGIFDSSTEIALKAYQINLGSKKPDGILTIKPDGKSGFKTYNALKKDLLSFKVGKKEENTDSISNLEKKDINESNLSEDEKNIVFFDMTNEDAFNKLKTNTEFIKKIQQSLINLGYKLEGKNNGVDGKLGKSTLTMLKKEQSKLIEKVQKNQFKNNKVPQIEDKTIRHNNLDRVTKQISKTQETINNLKKKLILTRKLNEKLEGNKYFYKEGNGYSIEALIREHTSTDKYGDIVEKKDKYNELFASAEGKAKLEKAISVLVGKNNTSELLDIDIDNSSNTDLLEGIKKILPWLFGIYLGDIPLSFMQTIVKGADIGKSRAFTKWIKDGMNGEFEDYLDEEKDSLNVVQSQLALRELLTTLNIDKKEELTILNKGLSGLTEDTKKLILTYGIERLLPDLKLLNSDSFGFFDRLFDKKSDEADKIIRLLEESLNNGVIDFSSIGDFINLIIKEGDSSEGLIKTVQDREMYFGEVISQNDVIRNIQWLSGLGANYQKLSILFYTKEIDGLLEFGVSENGKKGIKEIYSLIKNKDKEGIDELLVSNSELKEMVANFLTKAYNKVLLSGIPVVDNLTYENVGNAKHGVSLIGLSNEKAYNVATTTTSEKEGKISTLGLAYRSLVEKGDIYGITYEEYARSFKNKTTVNINSISEESIINTGRKEDQLTVTSFKSLAENRGDTEVFKMEDIVKEYTYYKDGQEVTEKVTYSLYIRPECVNPLIVQNKIETISTKKSIDFNSETYIGVDKYIPIVLPYFLLNNGGGAGNKTTEGGNSTNNPLFGDSTGGSGTSSGLIGGGTTGF